MAMDVNQAYCGDHVIIYTNIESLCCAPGIHIMLYVHYTSSEKKNCLNCFNHKFDLIKQEVKS